MKSTSWLSISLGSLALAACVNTASVTDAEIAAPSDTAFKISEISCWDLVTLDEGDAGYTYTLLYAYVAGQNEQALQKQSVVRRVTLAAIEDCEANPDKSALQAFMDPWEVG